MRKKRKIISGFICWLLFFILLVSVINKTSLLQRIDALGTIISRPVQPLKTFLLTEVTFLGDPVTIGLLTIGLMLYLWHQKKPHASVWYGLLQFFGYSIVLLVKYTVARPRPDLRLITVHGFSFPSGHTFSTVIFVFTLFAIFLPKLKATWQKDLFILLGWCWILLIMYSRVYLRAHYVSDVLGGLFLASGWWLLLNTQRQHFFNWLHKQK